MRVKYEKRRNQKLSILSGDSIPKNYLFFDTETTVPKKENDIRNFNLILGSAIYLELNNDMTIKRRYIYSFRTIEEFIDILEINTRPKNTLYCFAHNVGFDIRVLNLPYELNNRGYKSEPPIINDRVFIWRNKKDSGNLLFLDTANLGVHNVEGLGKDMGISKLEIDFDKSSLEELAVYCERDTEILEKFVYEYVKYLYDNNLGSFKVTLASQALTTFRTRFMHNQPVIHNNEKALLLERNSYHGGRTECFYIGELKEENYYYLDVNSMYPFAMRLNSLPIELLGISEYTSIPFLKARIAKFYVIADVLLNTNEPVYPVIKDNKLIFPIGKFRSVLTHYELEYAIKNNHIVEVYATAQYKKGHIFDKYVDFFYEAKKMNTIKGNKTLRYIDKLFLNSLYGKFGQSQPVREEMGSTEYKGVTRIPLIDLETGLHYQEINWFGDVYIEYREGETAFSCPSIAGAITGFARMLLWSYIKKANIENVFYMDTDSLIVNEKGYKNLINLIDDNELGLLKLEKVSNRVEIRGNKDYRFGEDDKTKGVPKKATKVDKNTWEYLEFQGFINWLNNGAYGAPKGEFRTKSRKMAYNKGIVGKDGRVKPYVFT